MIVVVGVAPNLRARLIASTAARVARAFVSCSPVDERAPPVRPATVALATLPRLVVDPREIVSHVVPPLLSQTSDTEPLEIESRVVLAKRRPDML